MTFDDFYDYLLNLCDKYAHRIDEQTETIDELQYKLKCAVAANKSYIERTAKQTREINALYKEIEQQKTEINRLKMVIELKDDARIELVKENTDLKKEIERLADLIEIRDDANIDLTDEIKDLESENAKLKKEINALYTLKNQLADDNNNLRATVKSYEQLFY